MKPAKFRVVSQSALLLFLLLAIHLAFFLHQVSREIFARMKSYITYRIASSLQLLVFFFLSVIFIKPSE